MSYSQYYFKNQHRVPTLAGVLIICFVLLFFIRIFTKSTVTSRASKKSVTKMEIANISTNQVTIYWQSDIPETGWIVYGENEKDLNKLSLDERDILSKKTLYKNHFVILRNLNGGGKYFYRLVSNNQLIGKPDGSPFVFEIPKFLASQTGGKPAYGKVINPNNSSLVNAIVIVRIEKTLPLVALTKSTGEWLIPLNSIIDSTSMQTRTLEPTEPIQIEITSEQGEMSNITTNISQISPLPQTLIIGKNYNFLLAADVLGASISTDTSAQKEMDILYPLENALIPGYRPLIKGYAFPKQQVEIMLQGPIDLSTRTVTDNNGAWKVMLSSNLLPGEYTIMLLANNKENVKATIRRKFTIAKNGEQVLGIATAEPTITAAETPIPTQEAVLTPTISYNAPTQTVVPTAPVSGAFPLAPIFGGVSLVIMGIGMLLVF